MNSAVLAAIISAAVAVISSLVVAVASRPKTRAETDQLKAAASVSVSADAREWAQTFIDQADKALKRADQAEEEADHAQNDAAIARQTADKATEKVDELESVLIECYGYVRTLRDIIRRHDDQPPPLPRRLEALWESQT